MQSGPWLEAVWNQWPAILRGPVTTPAVNRFCPNILGPLAWSSLLCQKRVDVICLAESLEKWDKVEELGVGLVIKPGHDGNLRS